MWFRERWHIGATTKFFLSIEDFNEEGLALVNDPKDEMFVLAYHLHWPLSELRVMATRERRWYIKRLTEQINYEKEQTKKAGKKTSGTQFGGKPVGSIPRPPPTRE